MGAATKHKQALLKTNPNCIFCGGTALATTVEHCPPRALFQNRQWPEGFEFAACHECNGGTSNEDLLLSMLARMNPFDDSSDSDGKTEGIVRRVVKQFPGIFSRMELSAAEARRNNRKLGITPTPGQLHKEAGVVRVPPEMTNAVCTFSSKLAKAVYFLHSQRIFPVEGCLLLHWFTNVHLYEKGHYPMLKQMEHFDGLVPDLVRTGRHLNDQFSYKLTMDRTHEVFAL